MKKVLSLIKNSLLAIFSFIVNLFNKKKNVILFESNSDFCDNPRALFDYMIEINLNQKYEIVWVVKKIDKMKKYFGKFKNVRFIEYSKPSLSKKFFKMIYFYSIAKYTFYSHEFLGVPTNKKQIRFFMTHAAVPLKNSKNLFWNYKKNTYVLSTSEFAAFYRCLTFGGGLEKFQLLGFPRNDKMLNASDIIKKKLDLNGYEKVILWMPTFKHNSNKKRNDYNDNSNDDITLLSVDNIKKINDYLKKKNMFLIIKFHPAQDLSFVKDIKISNIKTMVNDQLLDNDIDIYDLVGIADALITDFSSIYFDYLLLDRPIGFEIGDITQYKKGLGFLVENPLDYMPGNKIKNFDDIINFLNNVYLNNDSFAKERKILCEKVHKYKDNLSSKRIIEFLNIK